MRTVALRFSRADIQTHPSFICCGWHFEETKACFVHSFYFLCIMISSICSLHQRYNLSFLLTLFTQGIWAETKSLTSCKQGSIPLRPRSSPNLFPQQHGPLCLQFLQRELTYGYHWVLAGLAKELFLEAFWTAVDTGAKAFNDWGLRWFKGCLRSHRASRPHGQDKAVGESRDAELRLPMRS